MSRAQKKSEYNMNDLFVFNEEWVQQVCEVDGCDSLGQHLGRYHRNGEIKRRKKCQKHHGFDCGTNGWNYKKYRKPYCENIDGRLGFVCTSKIDDSDWEWQLDADHINGNPHDHREENIQTLCKCCHPIKSKQYKDYLTPGRTS
jgi:hypothetical protein|tara:strand:+ start:287 stop:718 length:432 start_codon:yes stop_codon:yes gene_type:complete